MTEKHYWWKMLSVLLMLYVLACGLLTPLKYGIVDVGPERFNAGQHIVLQIITYNAVQSESLKNISVYLKHVRNQSDSSLIEYLFKSEKAEMQNGTITAEFNLPEYLPDSRKIALFSVIVDDPVNGTAAIPSKIIIQQDSINKDAGQKLWMLTEKPQFHYANTRHFPYRNILVETIRNTFFHVSLWFAMFLLFGMSVYYSFRYLRTNDPDADLRSFALVRTGILFGILGCITGSLWARYTWETWWTTDIKLNMAALTILIYISYLVLRAAIEDRDRKSRISAAYNIFALVAVIPLIFVLPRLTDSLHPGNGGNPAFGSEDMDNSLRIVFYPAVLAFMLIGLWMASLLYRYEKVELDWQEKNLSDTSH
jgi:heme exporter protein C